MAKAASIFRVEVKLEAAGLSVVFLTTYKTTWCCNFYSKTNKMHNISNLFCFGTTIYMFQTVPHSIIRSPRPYIQHKAHVIQALWLLASRNIPASKQPQNLYEICLMLYVRSWTPDDGQTTVRNM